MTPLPTVFSWVRATATDSNHRYTTDAAIKTQMIAKGYVAEGYGSDAVTMCAPVQQVWSLDFWC